MGNTLFKISLTSVWALRLNCIFHFHERFLLQYRSWFLCKADSKTFNQKTKRNALVKLNTLSLQTDGWGWQTPFFSFLVRRNCFHTLYSFDTKTDFLPLCLLPSCMLVCISICNQCLSCLIELYSGFEEVILMLLLQPCSGLTCHLSCRILVRLMSLLSVAPQSKRLPVFSLF